MVETYALLARRLGLEAVRAFRSDLAPLLEVSWIDEAIHEERWICCWSGASAD